MILADLEPQEQRSQRFLRYFSLAPLANAGFSPDELQTYRNALAKLLNSLSWHPRITLPKAVDSDGLVLRIDLRDYQWDANLWNRLLADYPYGVLTDTAVGTGRRSSVRPRACPASAPTGSSPTPRARRSTTICCKSPRIYPNWSGNCTSTSPWTFSKSAWREPAFSAPAYRGTTASSSATTP